MVKRDVILSKISQLKEYIDFLKEIRKIPKEEYITNKFVYGSAERFLHLAMEAIFDICNHIISDLRLRKPENYKDIFKVLFENNIITRTQFEKFSKMAGFRNILVHDYAKINREIVYEIIVNNLSDFEDLVDTISEYI
ncbi:type VII toxin-antitoxin system HepT family RNase toxin [Caldicellulosiruptor morganii]|uniref:DUF86 domain-containing protein n=1 Tax=Caldicellulosiruptor morganii TaxID=1387555 RepID=A0ABY7BM97_9FIRM|nr:DUF86 domain-containing protein [Caldicellulosiruptor morganii]WAM33940.1 DUF86 domain-containing protein [Caldicellulosiruptor morganii]